MDSGPDGRPEICNDLGSWETFGDEVNEPDERDNLTVAQNRLQDHSSLHFTLCGLYLLPP